jgi:hypothetical protein
MNQNIPTDTTGMDAMDKVGHIISQNIINHPDKTNIPNPDDTAGDEHFDPNKVIISKDNENYNVNNLTNK